MAQQGPVFNQSTYQAYESNGWKFLEDVDSSEDLGFMLKSPKPVLIATGSYILFVCFIGPTIMRRREPFQMKNLIRFYNLIMVILAGILFHGLCTSIDSLGNLIDCKKTFSLNDSSPTRVYRLANTILMVRISEYLDTIFFTLRKKQSQVTFLHVFHHAFVPMYAYWVLRTAPFRFNVYILLINSLIHVLMYSYYFLATFQVNGEKPKSFVLLIVQKLLMFKKYMTQLQILQFITLAVYTIWAAIQPNHCNIPWTYIIANFLLAFGFLSLFLHFYINVYKAASGKTRKRD